jgi:TonB family protein
MRRRSPICLLVLTTFAALSSVLVENCFGQSSSSSEAAQAGPILFTLSPPAYPRIAQVAHITGDVHLTLIISQKGTVESAVVDSGPPLLQKAALESARQSRFECRGCARTATSHSYSLIYTFQLFEPRECTSDVTSTGAPHTSPPIPGVFQSKNHVTIVEEAVCIIEPASPLRKVRSVKCLYLWRCGVRP